MRKNLLAAIVLLALYIPSVWAAAGYPVRGRVIDRLSREPVAYAAVTITGQPGKGAMTDSLGRFEILQVKPGIYTTTPVEPGKPATGDSSTLVLWLALLAVSGMAVTVIPSRKKRSR